MRQFFCEIKEGFVELKLKTVSRGILGAKEKVDDLSEWDGLSRFDQIEALGNLFAEIDENPESCSKLEAGDGYRLSFNFASRLTEAQAITFGMPSSFPYAIQIKSHSNIGSKNYSVDWNAFGNSRKLNVSRTGCFLKLGTAFYRLNNSIWLIVECIDNFNLKQASSFDEKTAFVAELKSLLPHSSDSSVQFEGELASISLQHAVAFSLQITGDKNSVNFNPVLFNKITKEKAANSDVLIEEDEQALSPNDARSFAASFNKTNSVQSSYLLGPGNYVFVDPSLRPALNVVKAARKFDKESRVEFAKAPQKFIKNALSQQLEGLSDIDLEITAANIDRVFIETRQFSDRVTEMGVWQAPDLPWLETEPQDWRSDNYAFYVQGKTVTVPNSELEQAVTAMEAALSSGATTVEIGGQVISPDLSFLEFLKSLMPERPTGPDDDPPPPPPPPPPKEGPFALLTKENFESVQYNSRLSPRATPLDPRPPECKSDSITLKKHQKIGVDWLVETYNRGFPGVLVADDMGLGKTLQALMFLAIMVESGKTESGEPILIVAPVGLLKNWEEEHEKHLKSPGLGSFAKLYGNGLKEFKVAKGRDVETGNASLDAEKIKQCDWLLTTYETLRDYQTSFGQIRFSCVVFDEIQKVKNPRSLISHGATVLNRDFVIGLTGTPVENSLSDLWTIMDIISPGRLGDLKTFMSSYPEPSGENASESLENLRQLSAQLLEPSANGPAPVIRRMKTDLEDADLPEKVLVPAANTTSLMPRMQNDEYISRSNQLNSGQTSMIEALHAFKSISLHPISPAQFDQFSMDEYIGASARLSVAFKVLEEIHAKNEKALIFIESRAFQTVMASLLREKFKMAHQPLIINGLVSGEARQERVNIFQSNPKGFDVMIISPKAGGVGLTLTAANNVIHLERWWNPAVEDQCTDRAYRIGQTNAVKVYTPIARNESFGEKSFDCILDKLLENKRSLAKGLFIPTTINGDEFGGAFREGVRGRKLTLEEIDCFEKGEDFEQFVISELNAAGLRARRTQKSYDHGADIIVACVSSGKSAIVQCKHRSSPSKTVSEDAVEEACNAVKHYDLMDPKLYVVSNAGSFTSNCVATAEQKHVSLIGRSGLLEVGTHLYRELQG